MIQRHFTGYDQPLLPVVLSHLLPSRSTPEAPLLDLSQTVVLVPTRNVIRRLRAGLATRAGEDGRGLLSPKVLTPGSFAEALGGGNHNRPSATFDLLLWAEVLEAAEPASLEAIFGPNPPTTPESRFRAARFLRDTRSEILEAGLDFRAVLAGGSPPDTERWATLARLEDSYRRLLAREKREDPGDYLKKIAENPASYFPWERLVFAGVPDFPAWIATLAATLARERTVDVLVQADPGEEDRFDQWGRPRADGDREWEIPLSDDNIHLCQDAGEAIREAVELATSRTKAPWPCLLGIGDPASAPTARLELEERDIPAFDPSGSGFEETEGGRFVHLLCEYPRGTEPEKLGAWLRDPIVGRWLRKQHPKAFREKWIRDFDRVMEKSIPSDIDCFFAAVRTLSEKSPAFGTVEKQRQTAAKQPNLFALFEEASFQPLLAEAANTEGMGEFAEKLLSLREELEGASRAKPDFETTRLLVSECATFPLYEEHRQADALQILGWLELLWEDHPWLLLPDFLDGSVPSAPNPHPLLPESLRESLGLGNRRQREVRDAYIFRSLAKQRENGGRVDVFVPNRNLNGEVRAPSRLLYLVPREQLPQRVTYLSQEAEPPAAAGATAQALTLHPALTGKDWLQEKDSISVTSFASWLRCPFTFYLERVCNLQAVKTGQLEMDAAHFGTALHDVLSFLDSDPETVRLQDEEALCVAMIANLDTWFRKQFGERPNALLLLQKEGLQRRLKEACRLKAEARSEGWNPLHVEWDFQKEVPLTVGGIQLSGRMDLVEMRENGNEIRLIDYKTSDSPTDPEKDHWQNTGRGTTFNPPNLFPLDADPKRAWKNLQLPLYAAVLRQKYPKASIQVGYAQLPKALSESAFRFWEDFQPDYADEALRVAARIVQLWQENAFWPPTRNFERSDFHDMTGPEGLSAWDHGLFKNLEESANATELQP